MFRADTTSLPVKVTRRNCKRARSNGRLDQLGNEPGENSNEHQQEDWCSNPSRPVATQKQKSDNKISNSSGDTGSSTSENASSPKGMNKTKTRESAKILAPTRKLGPSRQSALAGALGNPGPINALGDVLKSPVKQFSIKSATDRTPERRSSHAWTSDREPRPEKPNLGEGFPQKIP